MLYPSIDSLLEKVPSKYLLVTLGAQRARELKDKENYQLEDYKSHKDVGKALEEVNEGLVQLAYEEEVNAKAVETEQE
ncbi:DNA-directed RNA polymerase subunit omega [Pallidibacillus pasinlerensis]|uniref:DNA-directed RNA polymerase subunit omega n=1 Tax=Pallidibacillus pasinlerensis TaxID=2703818 RepID=A0ABW9ZYG9_9BACI|nr:DNA-directed RNA polymerase subunit omega [Pallidibacillus pasinlerensis]NCU16227.1 DNA-directed RNA polymerase subunit omega [Pallidibacillus pasinlerensis]